MIEKICFHSWKGDILSFSFCLKHTFMQKLFAEKSLSVSKLGPGLGPGQQALSSFFPFTQKVVPLTGW